jgi:Bacterial regulatory proteins, luxR family
MTLPSKEWLMAQILRLTLSGYSQAEIAVELNISEGTVNALMKELVQSDNTLLMQHEIALVCQRTGLSIKQLASNLAFLNAITRKGFLNNKIHLFLQVWETLLAEDSTLHPKLAAQIFFEICTMYLKNGIPLNKLTDQLSQTYNELKELKEQINQAKKSLAELRNEKKKLLAECGMTVEKLDKFISFSESFEEVRLDLEDRVKYKTY